MVRQINMFTDKTEAESAFQKFHEENPTVYKKLVGMTHDLKARGHRKIGMQMLFEVLRWRSMLQTHGDPYKLNNNYCSRYARLIMANEEGLEDMFELRELRS
jgi:hypothetical protein